jgi:peptidoglycan/LPS O-acetylase OafA/YrhL
MVQFSVILLVLSFVLLLLAGFAWSQPEPRFWWGRLLSWGLAAAVLAYLISASHDFFKG